MADREAGALKRAVVVLMLVSTIRWAWSPSGPEGVGTEDVLPELLATSREAADEATLRSAPLAVGERIDPNLATEQHLDRLPGVGPVLARSIIAARDSGLVFRRPEDLTVVRGLGDALVRRVSKHLEFASPPRGGVRGRRGGPPAGRPSVDLNHADRTGLQQLPGIGPVIAERIIAERRKQMFTSIEDLSRVSGIGPATVERLRPHATVRGSR